MNKVIGILAHVDAGKTTLSEQILCTTQAIRSAGRVDHGDAFLDAHPLERRRGITIFSDQACFTWNGDSYFWVDTPGHADFSPEMERALSVLDYAVSVVDGAEGLQSHGEAIWRLLELYRIPTFFFVNKLDRTGADFRKTARQLHDRLSADIVPMECLQNGKLDSEAIEAIAERDEVLLDALLEGAYDEAQWMHALAEQVRQRKIFPVLGGAALRNQGVKEFLEVLSKLTPTHWDASAPFCAKVYKVRHDAQGERICFFKILSGKLSAREEVTMPDGSRVKVGELRRYHGAKYRPLMCAEAGELCAGVGMAEAKPGDMLGKNAKQHGAFHAEPMMAASVTAPKDISAQTLMNALRTLEDEEPTLSVRHNAVTGSIDLHIMGKIQLEILREIMAERFHIPVTFGAMRVLYQETIAEPCVGIGHYEPLRHYAEVHLRLSPAERGSGITFSSKCHVDTLALNWQRLIETHVFEKTHRGVLTGAPLTDVHVELLTGRSHLKHTEGGDFRESTYRAIRNALMYAKSVLLEPICRFSIQAPSETYGKIMGDMLRLYAHVDAPRMERESFFLTGEAAFSAFSEYYDDFLAATHGRGILTYRLDHYAPCRNADEVIAEANYNPLADDTPDSVFCAHGAGFNVPWDEVRNYAHLETPQN